MSYDCEADHQFLLKGDVFTKDVVETHLSYMRSREIDEIRVCPHPYEVLPLLRRLGGASFGVLGKKGKGGQ